MPIIIEECNGTGVPLGFGNTRLLRSSSRFSARSASARAFNALRASPATQQALFTVLGFRDAELALPRGRCRTKATVISERRAPVVIASNTSARSGCHGDLAQASSNPLVRRRIETGCARLGFLAGDARYGIRGE